MTLAFPRVASNNEGYFYPRQQFRPEFLTKTRNNYNQNSLRMNNRRAIYPFNNQNYFYPTPYLQVPVNEKANNYFYPLIYAPLNALPFEYSKLRNDKDSDGSIKLGTIVVLPREELQGREPKAAAEKPMPSEEKKSGNIKEKPASESSLIEDIVNYVPDALGFSDEDEDERQETIVSTTRLPSIKNDKFLNLSNKRHPQESEDVDDRKLPQLFPFNVNRAFNFSSPIQKLQNFTKQFSFGQNAEAKDSTAGETTTLTPSAEDLQEAAEDQADNKEDEKSPFGFAFGPQQQLQTYKEGGLIIQRLRVRHGGIAIAGPGGVATVISFTTRFGIL